MPTMGVPGKDSTTPLAWWREPQVGLLILLVFAAYFTRANALPLRGEEPNRAQMAREMVNRGDWLVPRRQGEPYLIRPPFQSWVIAVNCLTLGSWDAWAVRFPSLLATLLTTLLVYGYSRTFVPRVGALAAGAAFATLGVWFKTGRQAETEALFTLLVSASLLCWHWGLMRRWPDALTWCVGYGLMALAMLTKGMQAPAYFVGSVGLYLLLMGQWRRLLSWAHLLGALTGASVLGAWLIPYALVMGWPAVRLVWFGDPAFAFPWTLRAFTVHLLTFPLELAAGALPWSSALLAFLSRDFRRSIREARPHTIFLGVCLVAGFLPCWLHAGGLTRYFAPLYPCMAVLAGLAVQRCGEADAASRLRAAWRWSLWIMTGVMLAAAAAVAIVAAFGTRFPALAPWVEPPGVALAYAATCIGLAIVILRVRRGGDPSRVRTTVLALAGFLVITFSGVVTDVSLRRGASGELDMARLKERLPPGQRLVSFGHVEPLFTYLYALPVTPQAMPVSEADLAADAYFCFVCGGHFRPPLPFAWEEVGAISVDRYQHVPPKCVVVVGRRLPASAPAASVEPAAPAGVGGAP